MIDLRGTGADEMERVRERDGEGMRCMGRDGEG